MRFLSSGIIIAFLSPSLRHSSCARALYEWSFLEIFSMQSDTDTRTFEGFKQNQLNGRIV